MQTLARQLQIWRMENDLTQKEAAAVLRISMRSYQNWEQEVSKPNGLGIVALMDKITTWKRKQNDNQG